MQCWQCSAITRGDTVQCTAVLSGTVQYCSTVPPALLGAGLQSRHSRCGAVQCNGGAVQAVQCNAPAVRRAAGCDATCGAIELES